VYARIARFEGSDPAAAEQTIARVRQMVTTDRTPELDAVRRFLMLMDRQTGHAVGITFFDNEADLQRGNEALNAMTPEGGGGRTSVEMYEVVIDEQPA
jgi:hypothetical protein